MQVTQEVKDRVIARIKDGVDKANKFYPKHTFKMPTIKFTKRGTTAGTATGGHWEVNFNPVLLMENQDDFISRTVPHELAHLIDYRVNPQNHEQQVVWTSRGYRRSKRDVHGADFKFIMSAVLGADNSTRCHEYDVSRARVKKKASFQYRCTCGCGTTTSLGSKRHHKEQNRPGSYWLRGHGKAKLEFVGNVREPLTVAASAPKETKAKSSSHKSPPRQVKQSTGSIKDQAKAVFQTSPLRGDFIRDCVKNLGMKKSTASTYHHNFKSGKW